MGAASGTLMTFEEQTARSQKSQRPKRPSKSLSSSQTVEPEGVARRRLDKEVGDYPGLRGS